MAVGQESALHLDLPFGRDLRRGLRWPPPTQLLQQELLVLFRLGVAGENQLPVVGGGERHVEHLHGANFSSTARGVRPGAWRCGNSRS